MSCLLFSRAPTFDFLKGEANYKIFILLLIAEEKLSQQTEQIYRCTSEAETDLGYDYLGGLGS